MLSMARASSIGLLLVTCCVAALPANAAEDASKESLTVRLTASIKPGSVWVRDVAPRTMRTGQFTEGDTIGSAGILRNAVAQFGKPKGAVVGGDRSILTVTSPTRALIHTQATLPGGSLRIEGRFTFGTTKAVVLPVVDGSGAFAGARGSTTITQLSGRRALNVFRLRLP
jgi:hypothetical protein